MSMLHASVLLQMCLSLPKGCASLRPTRAPRHQTDAPFKIDRHVVQEVLVYVTSGFSRMLQVF